MDEWFLFGLSVLQLALFAPLAWLVYKRATLPYDLEISRVLQQRMPRFLYWSAQGLSYLGEASILNVLGSLLGFFLWRAGRRLDGLMMGITCLTGWLLKQGVQRLVNRPRPSPLLVHVEQKPHGKSFPSGHVMSSITFWGWLMLVANRQNTRRRKLLMLLVIGLIPLIGPARVLCGQHWTSDVLGGYLLGGGWLCLSLGVYRVLRDPQRRNPPSSR